MNYLKIAAVEVLQSPFNLSWGKVWIKNQYLLNDCQAKCYSFVFTLSLMFLSKIS